MSSTQGEKDAGEVVGINFEEFTITLHMKRDGTSE
jgi:hypothetical protein